jgi:hypothetical protein
VTSEVLDAEEFPIEALQGSSSATFFYCDIVFSILSYLDGAYRFDHLSVHRDVFLGMSLFVYFDFRVLFFLG